MVAATDRYINLYQTPIFFKPDDTNGKRIAEGYVPWVSSPSSMDTDRVETQCEAQVYIHKVYILRFILCHEYFC